MSNVENTINSEFNSNKKIIKNIVIVALSNFIKLLSGVLVAFIIPKMMGENNYGYYKTYTLYLTYVGLFHFGFCDGLFQIYAGKRYEELDKSSFRLYSKFLVGFQFLFALIICLVSLFYINNEYGYIFFFIGISMFASNVITHYQFISQVTGRFKELSIVTFIQSVLQASSVVILFILWKSKVLSELNFKIYTIIWTGILLLMAIWYVFKYRDITFGKSSNLETEKKILLSFFRIGFPLMIANLSTSLVLALDKQFVSILTNNGFFTIGEFGVYSFSYTMLQVITTVISAISTVLYPTIRTFTEEKLKKEYNNLISIIAIVTSVCLLSYQPLCYIVTNWLPKYVNSLEVFSVILPGIVISSCITMIMYNYYKSSNKYIKFFIITIIILIISFVANIVVFYLFNTLISISMASIFTLGIWYFVSEYFIIRKYKIKPYKNDSFILIVCTSFYVLTYFVKNIYFSFVLLLIDFILLILIFYFKEIRTIISKLKKGGTKSGKNKC